MRRALVLSGGSILGSFQAGAIAQVLESGFVPDAIYGTSVGSLNGAFLTERAGRAVRKDETPDWPAIGRELEQFWLEQLISPEQVAKPKPLATLFFDILRNRFNGLVDTRPLRELVGRILDPENLRQSPAHFSACSVNMATGEAVYATPDFSGFLEYVIASTAIPVEMPVTLIGSAPYVDGGVREVAPLRRAIDEHADEIVCIVCLPQKLEGVAFRPGNLREFAVRLMDIVTNELVNNDLQRFHEINTWVDQTDSATSDLRGMLRDADPTGDASARAEPLLSRMPATDWRHVELTVVRPKNPIVLDLLNFTREEVAEVVEQGRSAAREALAAGE